MIYTWFPLRPTESRQSACSHFQITCVSFPKNLYLFSTVNYLYCNIVYNNVFNLETHSVALTIIELCHMPQVICTATGYIHVFKALCFNLSPSKIYTPRAITPYSLMNWRAAVLKFFVKSYCMVTKSDTEFMPQVPVATKVMTEFI